jgi:hypothetical protein
MTTERAFRLSGDPDKPGLYINVPQSAIVFGGVPQSAMSIIIALSRGLSQAL